MSEFVPLAEVMQPTPLRQRSYRIGDVRYEECVCGGWLVANLSIPGSVVTAVRDHLDTVEHCDWRRAGGMEAG